MNADMPCKIDVVPQDMKARRHAKGENARMTTPRGYDDGREGRSGSGDGFGSGVAGSRRSGTGTLVGFGRRVGCRLGVRFG
jgi:hypothetical protein